MPDAIEANLTKQIRNFIWDDAKTPPISIEQLHKPLKEGGIKLLDIKTRNQAIDVIWLKSYLDISQKRPNWAFITDILINNTFPSGISNLKDLPLILQTQNPPTQGRNANKLPKEVLQLLKTAKKFNAITAPIKLSSYLKKQMPAWAHLGVPPKTYHKTKDKCLKTTHNAKKITDLVNMSARLENQQTHRRSAYCDCEECKHDRSKGCIDPNKCATRANLIIGNMAPKFNIQNTPHNDNLTLTHRRKEKNNANRDKNKGEITFDPTVSSKNCLSECFRIFTNPDETSTQPAYRLQVGTRGRTNQNENIIVYTDGSCINNGKDDAKCGAGIWIDDNHPLNRSIRIKFKNQSNQIGELVAILVTLQTINPATTITIKTD
ncbi:hypothetical protein BJ138DRAFT_1010851, partial [Hygrophoropsis aurantiaca]